MSASPSITIDGPVEAVDARTLHAVCITLRRSPSTAPLKRIPAVIVTHTALSLRRSPSTAPLKLPAELTDHGVDTSSPSITIDGPVEAFTAHVTPPPLLGLSPSITIDGPVEAKNCPTRSAARTLSVDHHRRPR